MRFLYNTFLGRIILLLLLHTHILKFIECLAKSRISKGYIKSFIKKNKIDMSEFDNQKFKSFNDFFTRKKDRINFDTDERSFISPCDGLISSFNINKDSVFRVKGIDYSLSELLKNKEVANNYTDGLCLIFRLRGHDYHRYCYIDDCFHSKDTFIKGLLHTVQPIGLEKKPVYRVNRRLWTTLDTVHFGKVIQMEVGAVLVGGIIHHKQNQRAIRGEEMGYFDLHGSTIILLIQKEIKDKLAFNSEIVFDSEKETPVKIGEKIAVLK